MLLDYGTLKIIWWFFIFTLFVLFFIFGGRDFGVCCLLPFVGKKDEDRRLALNSIGSTWEGNQVWFITAGGTIFAAWPIVYATAFSGMYLALMLVLLTLILRPPSIDFRSKIPNKHWRTVWDWSLFLSGLVPALIFGVGLGNLLVGLPFHFDDILQSHYDGYFIQLLNPFSILFGLSAIAILCLHGGIFLQKKMPDEYTERLKRINLLLGWVFLTLFLILGIWILNKTGYHIQSTVDINASLNPVNKVVVVAQSWLANYEMYPWLWLLPTITILAVIMAMVGSLKNAPARGLVASSLAITTALLTVNATLFPFIMPSTTNPNHSLTVWDATSSHRTLQYMFWVAIIFFPIIMAYTAWVFKVIQGKLVKDQMLKQPESY